MRGRLLPGALLLLFAVSLVNPAAALLHNGTSVSDLANMVEVEPGERPAFNSTNSTAVFDKDQGLNMPTGYIVLILAFLGIVIYSVDIDPFWIAILLFLVAFTAVVYYFSLPKYLIPVALVVIAGVKYYR